MPDHLRKRPRQQLSLSAMHLLLFGQQLTDSVSGQRKNQRQFIFPSVHCSRLLVAACHRVLVFTVQVCTSPGATVRLNATYVDSICAKKCVKKQPFRTRIQIFLSLSLKPQTNRVNIITTLADKKNKTAQPVIDCLAIA